VAEWTWRVVNNTDNNEFVQEAGGTLPFRKGSERGGTGNQRYNNARGCPYCQLPGISERLPANYFPLADLSGSTSPFLL
jgi:hypothetical protein